MKQKLTQMHGVTLPRVLQVVPLIFICLISGKLKAQDKKDWPMGGQNLHNTRNASDEHKISPSTVCSLGVKWVFTTGGDISANPAVEDGYVYFPDWAGNLYKLDAKTGVQVWKKEIKSYTGQTSAFARATPAIAGNLLIIGTQLGNPTIGARVLAINKKTGDLVWSTQVDDHFASTVTQAAVVYDGRVYVGVASQEEGFAADPTYPCCSFRGSMLSLDVKTGQIKWKTYIVPKDKGFAGGAVWSSTPVVDPKRNSIYITTGNDYKVPQAILDCVANSATPEAAKACIMAVDGSAQNYFDAFMSLDMTTGAVKWSNSVIPFDAWNVACFFNGPNCPDNAGPDYDFGQGAALFTVGRGYYKTELLGAGQKSGIYWALNPDNGKIVWQTQVGPGSTLGGLQWGSAVDDDQVYTAVSNHDYLPYTMTKGPGAGRTVNGGFFSSLNAATGAVVWENAGVNPGVGAFVPNSIASNTGMVTIANGVVFAGAMDAIGTMFAFDAHTGQKLWSFESGGSINSGAAVVDGTVYWGSGYANFGLGTPNNKFYAFSLGANHRDAISNVPPKNITEGVLVYPSPARNEMTVVSKDKSYLKTIQVYDLTGKLVKQFTPSASSEYKMRLAGIPAGNYMLRIETTTQNTSARVVITH